MKTKNRLKLLCTALAVSLLTVGGIIGFLSDADTATNTFTVGKISIDLQEPNWVESNATNLTPNYEVTKDPQILNDGKNPAYVFMEVKVPYSNLVTADKATGSHNVGNDTELWSYDLNDGWVEVDTPTKDEDTGYITHLYVWGTLDNCSELASGSSTDSLFDFVRFANVIEDQGLEEASKDIIINAYGIQTKNILDGKTNLDGANDDGKVSAEEVWSVISKSRGVIDSGSTGGGSGSETSFAVYSADDGSLNFYKRDNIPNIGDTFEGVNVTSVYTGFDNVEYVSSSETPWYGDRTNITNVNIVDGGIAPISGTHLFEDLSSVTTMNVSKLDTSKITNMQSAFNCVGQNATALTIEGLENWDVSNVTNMSSMFSSVGKNATTWSIGDISGWNTSSVTNMSGMFYGAGYNVTNFTLDLSGWDTSSVTDMKSMFYLCRYLTTIYVGDLWNVNNVTASSYMFSGCSSLVGQSGATIYNSSKTDKTMANWETGYLTYKAANS